LRQALGEGARLLDATRLTIGLRSHEIVSDVEALFATERCLEFELKRRLCADAIDLYRGPFLPGIEDDWARETRSRLATIYVRALIYLADAEMSEHPARALEYAERAIAEEPLLDGARARKVRALVRMGEGVAAQLEYEAFAELLDFELGMPPSEAVREALDNSAPPSHLPAPHLELTPAPSDLVFALESLSQGDRPHQAVSLCIALAPHWIDAGSADQGIRRLQEAVARSRDRLTNQEWVAAQICLAELTSASGDLVAAGEIVSNTAGEPGMEGEVNVKSHLLKARFYLARQDGKRAAEQAKEALDSATKCGSSTLILDALSICAAAALLEHRFGEALMIIDRTLDLATRLDEKMAAGIALFRKAEVLELLDRHAEAEIAVRQSLHVTHDIQSPSASFNRMSAARVLESLEFLSEAESIYRQVLTEFQGYDSRFGVVVGLTYLGDLVHATGRSREAVALHRRALQIRRNLHQILGIATSLRGLGKALCDLGDLNEAREALIESARLFIEEEALPGYASVLLARAHVESKGGHYPLATRLARRARQLLAGMTRAERKSIGRCGLNAIEEAEAIVERNGMGFGA
jgi:tetratricopeptide (TPR) repeat protein